MDKGGTPLVGWSINTAGPFLGDKDGNHYLLISVDLYSKQLETCTMGIIHHHTTVGNDKANGQVEWTIRMLKDCIWRGLTKEPTSFWMNHLALALLLLCMTASQMMGITPFLLAIGHQLLLPSMAIPGLPYLPNQHTLDKEEAYLAKVSYINAQL